MKRITSFITAILIAGTMCACGGQSAPDAGGQPMTVPASGQQPFTGGEPGEGAGGAPEIPEGAIADESGDFVYYGELKQIGDDEHGYIQIPADFVNFQDVTTDVFLQASDTTGKNIFSLNYYPDVDYATAAESMRAQMESTEGAEGVTGAKVSPNGYDAYQIYCHYTDGMFLVMWLIKDPANPSSCYYLAIEFDSDHQYIMACSSTFQTKEDYHKENG